MDFVILCEGNLVFCLSTENLFGWKKVMEERERQKTEKTFRGQWVSSKIWNTFAAACCFAEKPFSLKINFTFVFDVAITLVTIRCTIKIK